MNCFVSELLFIPQKTQSKALRVFSARKHSAISETTVWYRTTQQIFFFIVRSVRVSWYSYVKATLCACDRHVYSSGLWQLLHVSTCPCYRQGGISSVLHVEYSQLLRGTVVNRLTPNDPYMGRTAPLTSKRCILYIYSTNVGTEYFKHALYFPFFFSSKCSLFHNANLFGSCIIHILYTGCAKIKKNNSGAKGLRRCATNRKVAGSIPACVIGNFIDIKSFRSHYGPRVDSSSNRNEYQEHFLGIKAAGA